MAKVIATDSKMLSFHPMKTKMAMETKIMPQIVKTANRLNPIFNVAANTTITAMSNAKPKKKFCLQYYKPTVIIGNCSKIRKKWNKREVKTQKINTFLMHSDQKRGCQNMALITVGGKKISEIELFVYFTIFLSPLLIYTLEKKSWNSISRNLLPPFVISARFWYTRFLKKMWIL